MNLSTLTSIFAVFLFITACQKSAPSDQGKPQDPATQQTDVTDGTKGEGQDNSGANNSNPDQPSPENPGSTGAKDDRPEVGKRIVVACLTEVAGFSLCSEYYEETNPEIISTVKSSCQKVVSQCPTEGGFTCLIEKEHTLNWYSSGYEPTLAKQACDLAGGNFGIQ